MRWVKIFRKTIKTMSNKEVRYILKGEIRADNESRTIEGYAAMFDQEADLGFFREVIRKGAFDETDMSDVRALFNHDANYVLGRTASGTLSLEIDDKGLKYRFDAPNTTAGNDLLEMIRRGDISQSSFAFSVQRAKWVEEEGKDTNLREIERIDRLYDVSPVTYPAYEGTSVNARSLEDIVSEEHPQDDSKENIKDEIREMEARLHAVRYSLIKNG